MITVCFTSNLIKWVLPVGVTAGLMGRAVVGVFRGLLEDLAEPDEDVFLHPAPKRKKKKWMSKSNQIDDQRPKRKVK